MKKVDDVSWMPSSCTHIILMLLIKSGHRPDCFPLGGAAQVVATRCVWKLVQWEVKSSCSSGTEPWEQAYPCAFPIGYCVINNE